MPVYDCGVPDCAECQREFGPDRSKAIAAYQARLSAPVCKNKGGQVGMNGECLACTAEAGEICK